MVTHCLLILLSCGHLSDLDERDRLNVKYSTCITCGGVKK